MSRFALRAAAIGLALGASALTSARGAAADPATPSAAPSVPSSTSATTTPLGVRPTKPLELAEESPQTSLGWKLGAILALGGLGIWAWKHRAPAGQAVDVPALRILRRTSIGVRSELLVVEMDGQRLLLGVTPHAIQNLYIAPFAEEPEAVETATPAPVESVLLRQAVDSFQPRTSARELPRRPSTAKATGARAARRPPGEVVEEQARGIRALAERK